MSDAIEAALRVGAGVSATDRGYRQRIEKIEGSSMYVRIDTGPDLEEAWLCVDDDEPDTHRIAKFVSLSYADAFINWNRRPALTAYEAAKGGVGVKPLKWYHPLDNTKLQRADTIVGTYRVWTHSEANGLWFWALSDGYERAKGDVKSEADGLAAAETDHLSRIRSALMWSRRSTP